MVLSTMGVALILLIFMVVIVNVFESVTLNLEADAMLGQIVYYYVPDTSSVTDQTEETENISANISPVQSAGDSTGNSSASSGGEFPGTPAGQPDGGSNGDSGDNPPELFYQSPEDSVNSQNGFDINGVNEAPFSFLLPDIKPTDVMGAIFFAVTIDPDGHVIDTNVSRTMESASYASNMAISLYREKKKSGWLEKCKYTVVNDENGNSIYVFVHRDRGVENRKRVLWFTIGMAAFIFIAILVVILLMSKKILKPVEENIDKQKSFVTNASHELKTPLAIIQTNAEALELYNGENKWTTNIKMQIERLSVMLNNMLTLSRADEGVIRNAQEEVDLSSVTEELLTMYRESAEKKNLTLFRHIEESMPVRSSRTQIVQLLTILLDNTVKYALAGSTVEVHVFSRERNTIFETANRCEQLPECEPERLFERFYRPDSSRYSDTPGNGIGLSAARAIVTAYGGTIFCKYEGKDSIRFTVTFHR